MKKRIFSLLVALCLMVGLLHVVAFAAEEPALPEAEVEKLGAIAYTGEYYSYDLVGNQSLTTINGTLGMQIAMKFTAKDSAEQAAAHYYAGYTTDFYIEINGLADGEAVGNGCYLAGYYEAYGMWVKIPLDGFTIENGVVYPVITSAGFDFDYAAICKEVQSFTCGIYFSKEFLDANPGIEVNLSMGLSETYEQATKSEFITVEEYVYTATDLKALPEAEVEKLGATTYTGEYYSYDLVGNQSLTTMNGDLDMQIAMKFTAKDSAEQAAAHYYAGYTTDFYIEINGLANGEAVGNGCYLAGYYEAYGMWVKIPLDGFTIENGVVYPVITSAGFDFDYAAICKEVQSFTCGIYFSEEFLAANPGIEVTLSMGLSETYEQATKSEFITVEEYVYDEADLKGEHTHTEEIIPGTGATCTETGLTEGKKCAECGEILVAQEEIAALGHTYADSRDTTCDVCGAERSVPVITVENAKVTVNAGTNTLKQLHVFYTGDSVVDADASWSVLANAAKNIAWSPYGTIGYKSYTGAEQINAVTLPQTGKYVLRLEYVDSEGKGQKVSEAFDVKLATKPNSTVFGHKITVNIGVGNTLSQVHVFYVGDSAVADMNKWNDLVAAGKQYPEVFGTAGYKSYQGKYMDNIIVPQAGNYILRIEYVDVNGNAQRLSEAVKVEDIAVPTASASGKKVTVDPGEGNTIEKVYVFCVNNVDVANINNWNQLVAAGQQNPEAFGAVGYKTFEGRYLQDITLPVSGDYILRVQYSDGATAKLLSIEITL